MHPTRDRAKIPHARRLPTRGHLMAVVGVTTLANIDNSVPSQYYIFGQQTRNYTVYILRIILVCCVEC